MKIPPVGSARFAFSAAAMLLFACQPPLVDETYAALGSPSPKRKSINGIDAFAAMLQKEAGSLEKSAYLTRRLRDKADLVVHFQRHEISDESYFHRLEALLSGIDYEKMRSGAKTNVGISRSFPPFAQSVEPSDPTDNTDTVEDKEAEETAPGHYLTILYFLRDTDASVSFFAKLRADLKASPPHTAFAEAELQNRKDARELYRVSGVIPFGTRVVVNPVGPERHDLHWSSSAFPNGVYRFAVRALPGNLEFHFAHTGQETFNLLQTQKGEPLIREIRLEHGRMIVVCNAEPFLNYGLVRLEEREMAAGLVRYALQGTKSGARTVALVQQSLATPEKAATEESAFLRLLRVFPLNIIAFQGAILLLLFVFSRWPQQGRPLGERSTLNREFLEHFAALGGRLARTRDREEALRRLTSYLKMKTTRSGREGKPIG